MFLFALRFATAEFHVIDNTFRNVPFGAVLRFIGAYLHPTFNKYLPALGKIVPDDFSKLFPGYAGYKISLLSFFVVYSSVFGVGYSYMIRLIRKGPHEDDPTIPPTGTPARPLSAAVLDSQPEAHR